jgi:hypothetical protein
MIQAKLTGFETAETTLTLKMSRENWHEYVSEKVSLGDDCTISFGLPVDALTGITEHEKLESAIVEIMRLREILGMQHLRKDKRIEAELTQARAALKPVADLLVGDLKSVGGGTLIAPTIKVQVVKDAKAALSSVTQVNDAGWDISTTNRAQKIANQELAQERGEEAEAATETANRGRAC